jgi:hypothetical protein
VAATGGCAEGSVESRATGPFVGSGSDGVGVPMAEVLRSSVGAGVGVADWVGEGAGQAGPSAAASLTCGPFPDAGSVITRIPKYARRPHATSPGSCVTLLV